MNSNFGADHGMAGVGYTEYLHTNFRRKVEEEDMEHAMDIPVRIGMT
jgi:hypothetical protein